MTQESAVRLRAAEPKDAPAICELIARSGLGSFDPVLWLEDQQAFPVADDFPDIPTGWVLETGDGAIVGNLNNVRMLYEMEGRPLRGVVAAGWAVDPGFRGKSLRLMTTFFKQPGVDLCLNVSANPTTAKVLTGMKIARLPIPGYDSPCLWALRPRAFAKAALVRRSIPAAGALALPAGLLVLAGNVFGRSRSRKLSSSVARLDSFDDRFNPLWEKIRTGPLRLRAVRTPEILQWRFRTELRERRIIIIGAERQGTLLGYAVLVRRAGAELGMEMYDVADLQAAGDDPLITRDLLLGAMRTAREAGADALKLLSGTPAKRNPALALGPYTYQLPFWQQYFQASTPGLAQALSTADTWDFSVFDTF